MIDEIMENLSFSFSSLVICWSAESLSMKFKHMGALCIVRLFPSSSPETFILLSCSLDAGADFVISSLLVRPSIHKPYSRLSKSQISNPQAANVERHFVDAIANPLRSGV